MKKVGCGLVSSIVLLNLIAGGMSVAYILAWFGKDIPMIMDVIIGLIFGEISIPIALVGYILKLFGVF